MDKEKILPIIKVKDGKNFFIQPGETWLESPQSHAERKRAINAQIWRPTLEPGIKFPVDWVEKTPKIPMTGVSNSLRVTYSTLVDTLKEVLVKMVGKNADWKGAAISSVLEIAVQQLDENNPW